MRPRVTLKLATSLDGRIATAAGESQWITGEEARLVARRLRAEHDAVMIGIGTALADDPELTVRGAALGPEPLRVVLDSQARLVPTARLLTALPAAPLLILTGADAPPARVQALRERGALVEAVAAGPEGLAPEAALERLAAHGRGRVFVEGGGRVAAAFLRAGVVDRLEWFRAPILLGGDGLAAPAALGLARLTDAPRFRRLDLQSVGPDLWERYEREA